jgi:hypothetical protein
MFGGQEVPAIQFVQSFLRQLGDHPPLDEDEKSDVILRREAPKNLYDLQ